MECHGVHECQLQKTTKNTHKKTPISFNQLLPSFPEQVSETEKVRIQLTEYYEIDFLVFFNVDMLDNCHLKFLLLLYPTILKYALSI